MASTQPVLGLPALPSMVEWDEALTPTENPQLISSGAIWRNYRA
jgi:hypothetical protein